MPIGIVCENRPPQSSVPFRSKPRDEPVAEATKTFGDAPWEPGLLASSATLNRKVVGA